MNARNPSDSFRKLVGPMRISSSSDGSLKGYRLPARAGGSQCKVIQYMIKVYQGSGNVKVGLNLDHGPDGEIYASFGTVIVATNIASAPTLLVGATGTPDTDVNDIIGEWIVPVVTVEENTASGAFQWVIVEIWELRKGS